MLDTVFSSELIDFWISIVFLLVTLLLAELLRLLIHFALREGKLSKRLLQEFVATGELCACCFELCVIVENYGIKAYASLLFLLTVWWSFRWGDASACPYTHVEDVIQGQTRFRDALIIIIIQIFGGWAIYPFYVKKFWMMKYEEKHELHVASCSADLTVPAIQGAFIEGIATCICQLTGRVMSKLPAKHGVPVTAIIGTTLVVAAFDMSGGYFNPVLATSLQYNCGEISRLEHFIVYWIGSIGGSILSVLIWNSGNLSKNLLGIDTRLLNKME